MSTTLPLAWHEGYDFYNGEGVDCPYEVGTQQEDDWQWGYSCAQTDDERYQRMQEDYGQDC